MSQVSEVFEEHCQVKDFFFEDFIFKKTLFEKLQ